MSNLFRIDIIIHNDDLDLATGLIANHISFGWEEQNIDHEHTLIRIHNEDENILKAVAIDLTNIINNAKIEYSTIANQDWTSAWKEFFTPIEAGKFIVLPPWLAETDKKGKIPIFIDPKSAFGTGHHASTVLCLEAISYLYDQGKIKAGMNFLDLGTGTGILGIACAKLGLTGKAADIDPVAITNAHENAELNQISSLMEIFCGSTENFTAQHFDLVIANILAEPLRALAPAITALIKPNGNLILSGILDKQAKAVEESYSKLGTAKFIYHNDWTGLIW